MEKGRETMKLKKIEGDKIRCPKCNSTQVYTRIGKNVRVCRRCGHEWEIKKVST